MNTIPPTVGRKVWFYSSALDHFQQNDDKQPFDATITYVWSPTEVNLLVVNHNGQTFSRQRIELRDPTEDDRHGAAADIGYATWMPYQIGQAKAAP